MMSRSKLEILLKNLQDAQNVLHTHFLSWSFNEFEQKLISVQSKSSVSIPTPSNELINNEPSTIKKTSVTIKKTDDFSLSLQENDIKKSSWELYPMNLENSNILLPINEFSCLKNKIISFPKIFCAIFIKTKINNEILFLERLSKIITKFLFSSQIIHLNKKEDFPIQIKKFSLNLVPIKELILNGIKAKTHTKIILNNNVILPLEDINKYTSNSLLKQDLWKQLNQINQNMQK